MAASRLRAVGTAGVVGVLPLTLGGCGAKSDWTEQQLEAEGAKLIKQDFGVDTTIDCPAGLENKQGPSVMCTAPTANCGCSGPTTRAS